MDETKDRARQRAGRKSQAGKTHDSAACMCQRHGLSSEQGVET